MKAAVLLRALLTSHHLHIVVGRNVGVLFLETRHFEEKRYCLAVSLELSASSSVPGRSNGEREVNSTGKPDPARTSVCYDAV